MSKYVHELTRKEYEEKFYKRGTMSKETVLENIKKAIVFDIAPEEVDMAMDYVKLGIETAAKEIFEAVENHLKESDLDKYIDSKEWKKIKDEWEK